MSIVAVALVATGMVGLPNEAAEAATEPQALCSAVPEVTRLQASGSAAGAPGERVTVSSTLTLPAGQWYQSVLTRPDGTHYFSSVIDLDIAGSQLVGLDDATITDAVLTVDGAAQPLVAGTQPVLGAWAAEKVGTTWRVYLPADGAALLAQDTPRDPAPSYLAPSTGGTLTFSLTGTIPVEATAGQLLLAATCTAGFSDGTTNGSTAATVARVAVVEPALTLTKVSTPASSIPAGGFVDYVVTATVPTQNGGHSTSTAHHVDVIDVVPAGLTPVDGADAPLAPGASTPSGGVWSGDPARTLTFSVTSIDPGQRAPFTYRVKVDDDASGPRTNTVTASMTSLADAAAGRSYPAAGSASDDINITGSLPTITKQTATEMAVVNQNVAYTLEVTFPASSSFHNLTISDDLPQSLLSWSGSSITCVSGCPPLWNDSDAVALQTAYHQDGTSTLGWYLGQITTGSVAAVFEISYTAIVSWDAVVGAELTNTAHVGANSEDELGEAQPNTAALPDFSLNAQASATIEIGSAVLGITKGVDAPADKALTRPDSMAYTVVITNTGNVDALDVVVQDYLQGSQHDSWALTGPSAADPNLVHFTRSGGTIARVPAGGSVEITYATAITQDGAGETASSTEHRRNTARVRSFIANGVRITSDASVTTVTRILHPALGVEKAVAGVAPLDGRYPVALGSTIVPFEVVLTNTGAADAFNLGLVDTLPAGWWWPDSQTFVQVTAPDGTISSVDVSFDGVAITAADLLPLDTPLHPGESVLVTYALEVPQDAAAGSHVNSVRVTGQDAQGRSGYSSSLGYEPLAATDTATVDLQPVTLELAKTPTVALPGTLEAGETGQYTVVLRNTSSVVATDLVIDEQLPRGLTLEDVDGVPTYTVDDPAAELELLDRTPPTATLGERVLWQLSQLAPNATIRLTVPVRHDGNVLGEPELLNTVTATDATGVTVSAEGLLVRTVPTAPPCSPRRPTARGLPRVSSSPTSSPWRSPPATVPPSTASPCSTCCRAERSSSAPRGSRC